MKKLLIAIAFLPMTAYAGSEQSVNSAYKVCALVDRTGLSSSPCEVSGWNSTVTLNLDMSSTEARKTCGMVANLARNQGWGFDSRWQLHIKSPYSKTNIAYCSLG